MIVFGYFLNPCYHESAARLISLHTTKAGAWRAMHRSLWTLCVNARDYHLQFGGMPELYRRPAWEHHFIEERNIESDG